jgi:hypothetical protein
MRFCFDVNQLNGRITALSNNVLPNGNRFMPGVLVLDATGQRMFEFSYDSATGKFEYIDHLVFSSWYHDLTHWTGLACMGPFMLQNSVFLNLSGDVKDFMDAMITAKLAAAMNVNAQPSLTVDAWQSEDDEDTLKFDLELEDLGAIKPACLHAECHRDAVMQRTDDDHNFWFYCKKCGIWLRRLVK